MKAIRAIMRQGADPNAQVLPDDNRSVWKRIWDLLRRGSGPTNSARGSALMKAIQWYPRGDSQDYVDWDNADTVRALVEAGTDVNSRFTVQTTLFGKSFATTPLIEAAAYRKWKVMQMLLAGHADANAADDHGCTALMYTAANCNADMVEALLKHRTNVDSQDDAGETALFWVFDDSAELFHTDVPQSASVLRGMPEDTVACLLRFGASVNIKNRRGQTLLTVLQSWNAPQLNQMLKRTGVNK